MTSILELQYFAAECELQTQVDGSLILDQSLDMKCLRVGKSLVNQHTHLQNYEQIKHAATLYVTVAIVTLKSYYLRP